MKLLRNSVMALVLTTMLAGLNHQIGESDRSRERASIQLRHLDQLEEDASAIVRARQLWAYGGGVIERNEVHRLESHLRLQLSVMTESGGCPQDLRLRVERLILTCREGGHVHGFEEAEREADGIMLATVTLRSAIIHAGGTPGKQRSASATDRPLIAAF